eukprot:TRINITY_DN6593_c0_g1_i3.p1 TRINITY_DN6593_c0_g1~~TRINITY_DN6593_c0_g1_i3.p1  ORF type:complete len:113 (+),score=36.47 TRINITY_DN6593_c0_g1_i3:343-681(+)
MTFSFQVSANTKALLASYANANALTVSIQASIYEFDPLTRKYFQSFSMPLVSSVVEVAGRSLYFEVADEKAHEVSNPENYTVQLHVVAPNAPGAAITLATAFGKTVAKKWTK